MVFSAKRAFLLSWLLLLKGRFCFLGSLWRGSCRAPARLRERKTTPQSPAAPAPLTRGARSVGRLVYVPICHTNYKAFSHSMANFSKTKNQGDVHETHPPGLVNKSDENNQRTFFLLQKNHTKELMHSFPPQQRLQLIHEYGILSSRRCWKSGW